MAKCDLCGEEVGLLKKRHKECQAKYDQGVQRIAEMARTAALRSGDLDALEAQIRAVARECQVDMDTVRRLVVQAWHEAASAALKDNLLTAEEEAALVAYQQRFSLSREDVNRNGAHSNLLKAGVLRDLLEGLKKSRFEGLTRLPFKLQKGEYLIWVFTDVKYYEQRTKTAFVGSSQGVSIRIAKGVYYRLGGFKGHPVKTTERPQVDMGVLGVTNKHIYFVGRVKAFRIRNDAIVGLRSCSDGIGIQRDSATALPQFFETGDGWFTYNLLANLSCAPDS